MIIFLQIADSSCRTQKEQTQVLNSARLLTRLIPYIFEDPDWRSFFWSAIPSQQGNTEEIEEQSVKVHKTLNILIYFQLLCYSAKVKVITKKHLLPQISTYS